MTPPVIHPAYESWSIRKPEVRAAGGIVTSQHHLASAAGARMLEAGGNAVDAAVAAGLALGSVEPWMSGLGGGGFMVVHVAAERRAYAVEFGMRAPRGIDPAAYPLADGVDADLFGWPSVVEDRNVLGPLSFAAPGFVAGHAAALERFGTRSWRDATAPAVELAQRGMTVDWHATLRIARGGDLRERRARRPSAGPYGGWGGRGADLVVPAHEIFDKTTKNRNSWDPAKSRAADNSSPSCR